MPLLCYLDAFSGISGDMLVGALADAGADQAAIVGAIASLEAGATVSFEKVKRTGIAATKYHVAIQEAKTHRHLHHIVKMIEAADLAPRARRNAIAVFQRLGEAEADVHDVPIEKVHFHEVGAADSIADIVGACVAFDLLGVDDHRLLAAERRQRHRQDRARRPARPRASHRAPARPARPSTRAVRPGTDHAHRRRRRCHPGRIVRRAARRSNSSRTGYGAGDHDFREHANVLRVILGEPTGAAEATTVSVIEANIDDLSPQVLAYAAERLMEAGALDVTLQPLVMKKGRPGTLLRVIARPEHREAWRN